MKFRDIMGIKILVAISASVGGCYAQPASDPKTNVYYWTYTGKETCVDLAGMPYCFLNKDVDAASFITDSDAGFLFMAPTNDPDLVECAESWYKVDWPNRPYPNIHMTVSEPSRSHDPTGLRKYQRARDLALHLKSNETKYLSEDFFAIPRQYVDYYGEKCIKFYGNDLIEIEVVCHGGIFKKGGVAYFWGCENGTVSIEYDKNGKRVSNPSCRNHFFFKNLEYSVTASKKCAPFMNNKLRDFALNFVQQGQLRAHRLSGKPKRPIE